MTGRGSERAGLREGLPLVIAGFVISFVLIGGGVNSVGVFLNAIAQGTEWTRSALSLAVGVGAGVAALCVPAVGLAVDRVGVRVPMTGGLALLAAGFSILVGMQAPWQFVAANVLLGAGFAASALFPITVAITLRIRERTALALGLAAAGSSAGALVLAPMLQLAIEALGWRTTYLVLGVAVVATPLPLLAFALPRGRLMGPAAVKARGAAPLAGSGPLEWLQPGVATLAALLVLPNLATFAVSVHLVPYLTGIGLSGRAAALALGTTVGISALGKILGGAAGDRLGLRATLQGALLLGFVSLGLLAWASEPRALVGFVALYGLALGTYVAVIPPLARDVLGAERFGARYGTLQLGGMLAAAAGPVLAGACFDATGRYREAIGLWQGALAAALAVSLRLRAVAAPQEPQVAAP